MIKLSFSQKSACGFKYILDKTEPYSAPGKNALKKRSFCAGQKAELLTELENVERLKKRSPAAQRRFHVWKACFSS